MRNMAVYIHQLAEWPTFNWNEAVLAQLLAAVRYRQGRLLGQMESMGFSLRNEAMLQTLTLDVLKSNEIEGEILNPDQVRSSIARQLGLDIAGMVPSSRNIEGVVEMMLDATQQFNEPLTKERLFGWHAALFPTGHSGIYKITAGNWRYGSKGKMQVVSGALGKEMVHFEAPDADKLDEDMKKMLAWFNEQKAIDPVIKAGVAHLWFVTIHPFDDGNGRIARAIADMQLARADGTPQRFYSMSAQIQAERNVYYAMLEQTQKGALDITSWLVWFLECLQRALMTTGETLALVLNKAKFWDKNAHVSLNKRQHLMLNKLLDGFTGKLTSSKWAKISKCSQDTALRDIQELVGIGILIKESAGGRSTSYLLKH
jgi:Fic family protein